MILRRSVSALYRAYLLKTDPIRYARRIGVTVGPDCWFPGLNAETFGSEPYLVTIGRHVALAAGVQFVTHEGGTWLFRDRYPDLDVVAPISVGDDVVFGANAIILPGVSIGSQVIVGAGSVVARDVPDGVVVAGVPARILGGFDEYRERMIAKSTKVGHLSPRRKRETLIERFAMAGDQDG